LSEIRVRAARGAIRVERDVPEVVLEATERLLRELLSGNDVDGDDIVSAFFTVTEDLRSAFPAVAARRMGLGRVPLLCAQEIPVEGSMHGVIRVLLQFHSARQPSEVVHIYLDGAETLRDDLA
jgi:chorismate mutase